MESCEASKCAPLIWQVLPCGYLNTIELLVGRLYRRGTSRRWEIEALRVHESSMQESLTTEPFPTSKPPTYRFLVIVVVFRCDAADGLVRLCSADLKCYYPTRNRSKTADLWVGYLGIDLMNWMLQQQREP